MSQPDPDHVSKLLDILQRHYPVLHQLIGDDYFTVMGCRYYQRYPPEADDARFFGDQLADFLKVLPPYAHVPSLAELADFEWAMGRAVSSGQDNMTVEYWQSLDPHVQETTAFHLHPSLTILKLDWNAPHIWQAASSGQEVPEPVRQAGYWLVYPPAAGKPEQAREWRRATPLEIAALESVYHGLTVAELRDELGNLVDDGISVPLTVETFIHSWLEQGLLLLRQ